MAKIKVDFTGVESRVRAEEGEHIAVLKKIERKTSSNGNDMLAATFQVVTGSSSGATVYDNFPLTDTALWKLKMYLEAIGMKVPEGKLVVDTDAIMNKRLIIGVNHEEYQGTPRARINEYKSLAKAAAADDDDEDIDDEDFDEDEEEETPPPKKKKKPAPAPAPTPKKKAKKKPEPEEDEDDDDEDDWDEA
jgi:hypothetical protein